METQHKQHPSALHLAALALGKLKPDTAAKIQSHLTECADCRRFVSDTPRAELAEIIKQSKQQLAAEQNTMATGFSGTVASLQASQQAAPPPLLIINPIDHAVGEGEIPHDLFAQSKYRILRLLGRGGMGTVYEAQHVRMDRRVAIKVINPELVDHPQALLRFEKEIQAVASLDHANIARAFDAEPIGSLQAFVMEFVRGQTLYDFLKSRGRLSVVDASRCIGQALRGLQHAHERQLVHRDLKPQNLMLSRDIGQIKILDFGLAKAVSENRKSLTNSGATMGTYAYMAPEQALDAAKSDIRADIYSLGCTLYLLLSGVLPFERESDTALLLAHQSDTPRPLKEICPEIPEGLSNLVSRMLAKDPADRPQTPREAADALLPFARGKSDLSPPVSASGAQPVVTGRGGNRWRRATIAAASIAFLGFCGWALGFFSVRTPDGTIIIENAPPDADVVVDGQNVSVERNGDIATIEAVKTGSHHLKVVQSGREVWSNDATIKVGGQQVVVRFVPPAPAIPAAAPVAPAATVVVKPASAADSNAAPAQAQTGSNFVPLFNKKDLSGWKTHPSMTGSWNVADGILKSGTANSHLYSVREDFQNVHLRVKLQMEAKTRCCIYVRGEYGPKFFPNKPERKWANGLEVGLCTGGDPIPALVSIYTGGQHLQDLGDHWLPAHEPIQLDIVVQNDRASILLNGQTLKEFDDVDEDIPKQGYVILQNQFGQTDFESVEVEELPPDSRFTPEKKFGPVVARNVKSIKGNWQIEGDELISEGGGPRSIRFGDPNWTDIDLKYDCMRDNDVAAMTSAVQHDGEGNRVSFEMGGYGGKNMWCEIYCHKQGKQFDTNDRKGQQYNIEANKWYHVHLICRGLEFTATISRHTFSHMTRAGYSTGCVAFAGAKAGGIHFRNVSVTAPDGTILWEGLPDLTEDTAASNASNSDASDLAALLPLGSSWTGTWTMDDAASPATAKILKIEGKTLLLEMHSNSANRNLSCTVDHERVNVDRDAPAIDKDRITKNVKISGQIIGRDLSIEGTEEQLGPRGKKSFGVHHVKLTLRRDEASANNTKMPTSSRAPQLIKGDWRIDGGELISYSSGSKRLIQFGDPSWTDFDFSYEFYRDNDGTNIGASFHIQPGHAGYFGAGNLYGRSKWAEIGIRRVNATERNNDNGREFPNAPHVWYHVLISCRGSDFTGSIDGQPIGYVTRREIPSGYVGLWVAKRVAARFRNLKVTAPDGTVLWEGLPDPSATPQSNVDPKAVDDSLDEEP